MEEQKIIDDFITNKFNGNFYILRLGETENYLGIGNTNKYVGYKRGISFLNDSDIK